MNLSLVDPFFAQDYPESTVASLLSGHSSCVRFNRQGNLLASGRVDGTVTIFDIETNGVARKLRGHVRQVQSLSWSRDGRYLLSSSQDGRCILWDLEDGSIARTVKFGDPVYIADLHPLNPFVFAVSLFEGQPQLVDASDVSPFYHILPSAPKRADSDQPVSEKQAAQDAKFTTTVAIFTATGDHIISGTNKGWLNIIDARTRNTIYSTRLCTGVVIFMRLSNSGRDLVVLAQDRIIRSIQLPNLSKEDLDPDTIQIEVEHKFQDVVNRLAWNHVAFSATGEYIIASTYNNHDIYIWERGHGSLVKILEGPKEEVGVVDWHPTRPVIAACGLEFGDIHLWAIVTPQRWSALAPDFAEVEENVEYEEREDEFDIHPKEEIHKRRLDLEDENVDVVRIEPLKGDIDVEDAFQMPVVLGDEDDSSEEEYELISAGTMRRKSPASRSRKNDNDLSSDDDRPKKKKAASKRNDGKKLRRR